MVSERGARRAGLPSSAGLMDDQARACHRLGMLATAMAGRAVTVQPLVSVPAGSGGGLPGARPLPARAVLGVQQDQDAPGEGLSLMVPVSVLEVAVSGSEVLAVAMVAHAVAHLRHSPLKQDSQRLKPMGVAVVSAIEDARVEHLLLQQYPGARAWFEACRVAPPDPDDLGFTALMARLDRALADPSWPDGHFWVEKARRLFLETQAQQGLADYGAFRAVASILGNDLGQMRVRMDPQHFVVPSAYRDDNSCLWLFPAQHQAPEEALTLQQSPPVAPPPSGLPPPAEDQQVEAVLPDEGVLARYQYPEWDRRLARMRPDWCTVLERWPAWQAASAQAVSHARRSGWMPLGRLPTSGVWHGCGHVSGRRRCRTCAGSRRIFRCICLPRRFGSPVVTISMMCCRTCWAASSMHRRAGFVSTRPITIPVFIPALAGPIGKGGSRSCVRRQGPWCPIPIWSRIRVVTGRPGSIRWRAEDGARTGSKGGSESQRAWHGIRTGPSAAGRFAHHLAPAA